MDVEINIADSAVGDGGGLADMAVYVDVAYAFGIDRYIVAGQVVEPDVAHAFMCAAEGVQFDFFRHGYVAYTRKADVFKAGGGDEDRHIV